MFSFRSDVDNYHRKISAASTTITLIASIKLVFSRFVLSLVGIIVTIMLTAVTLIVRWNILYPIHNEIIDKFQRNESLFFQRHEICKVEDVCQDFNIITFPTACLLIVMLFIRRKRVSLQPGKICTQYIGIPVPLDFFVHIKRTFPAVIFAIFADELLEIVTGLFKLESSSTDEGTSSIIKLLSSEDKFSTKRANRDFI